MIVRKKRIGSPATELSDAEKKARVAAPVEPINVETAKAKAAECREVAARAANYRQRVVLNHMADTWTA